jgi:hypothetical protein
MYAEIPEKFSGKVDVKVAEAETKVKVQFTHWCFCRQISIKKGRASNNTEQLIWFAKYIAVQNF